MGSVIKSNRYRMVDNHAFELPLPLGFEIWEEEYPVAEYKIEADETVSCVILTKYKEYMLTPLFRPLNINDMYYLMSCRVFQDRTPYTGCLLERLGLKKFSVYDILRKTHGVTPYDKYWLKFDGESITYQQVFDEFCRLTEQDISEIPPAIMPEWQSFNQITADDYIRHTPEISSAEKTEATPAPKSAEKQIPLPIVPDPEPEAESEPRSGTKMSQEEIEALLSSVGLGDNAPEPTPATAEEPTGGKMSQADIEAMFAQSAPEPTPAEEPAGGKMSQEDIERMLADMKAEAAK